MAIVSRIFAGQRLVHTWTNGGLSDADMSAHRTHLLADPDFRPDFDQLIECLGALPSAISQEGVSAAVTHSVFSKKSRRAIVAVQNASFGVARMFALMQPPGIKVEVFREIAPALRWLGRPGDLLSRAETDRAGGIANEAR
jgi:hypothetical protein